MQMVLPRWELEAVIDAVADICRAHAVAKARRGRHYSQFAQDVEDQAGAIENAPATVHNLGDGYYIFLPPPALTELLRRARELRLL